MVDHAASLRWLECAALAISIAVLAYATFRRGVGRYEMTGS
jgi:hypothetical protein